VYDKGNIFDIAVLDITDEAITQMFGAGLKNIAAISLAGKALINRSTYHVKPFHLSSETVIPIT
jgi:hypothetical protein